MLCNNSTTDKHPSCPLTPTHMFEIAYPAVPRQKTYDGVQAAQRRCQPTEKDFLFYFEFLQREEESLRKRQKLADGGGGGAGGQQRGWFLTHFDTLASLVVWKARGLTTCLSASRVIIGIFPWFITSHISSPVRWLLFHIMPL